MSEVKSFGDKCSKEDELIKIRSRLKKVYKIKIKIKKSDPLILDPLILLRKQIDKYHCNGKCLACRNHFGIDDSDDDNDDIKRSKCL